MRVAIVGGGIMGCATALALANRGASVIVLERAVPGAEASSAAAGILGAQLEAHAQRAMVAEFVRARAGYAAWAERLRDATGIDIGYRASGALRVAHSQDEHASLAEEVAWQREKGLRAELLDASRARSVEPELGEIVGAAHFPDEAQVDPPSLLRALLAAIVRAHVEVRSGTTVERLIVEHDRCVGVALDDSEVRADAVVLAAGSWSSLVPGLPASLPRVRPVRGQIVQLDERPPRLRTIVLNGAGYVVPRGDGRVLCGSTTENVGFRKEVTAGGARAILDAALTLVPSLEHARLDTTWSNFRPQAASDVPLVGSSPLPGLFLATGHFRNGILLAGETADRVARAVLGPTSA
jgi:glycine oxidase